MPATYTRDGVSAQTGSGPRQPMLVYNKKRNVQFMIRREDGRAAYDALEGLVRENGLGGLKAYLSAELRSLTELVVRTDLLAEQSF